MASATSTAKDLRAVAARLRDLAEPDGGPLRVGVDLGTSSCVIVVLDGSGSPVWVDTRPTAAIRDGVVVDFFVARDAVQSLKSDAEAALGVEFTRAATAYPPGTGADAGPTCRFVLESAGFDEVVLVDEVSAAQRALQLTDGVLVDVGGGSTGVGVFRGGDLIALDDRAGGGHHLDLVLAGGLGIELAAAEKRKRKQHRGDLGILRAGVERVAESIRSMTVGAEDLPVHLAGGALMITGAADIIAGRLDRQVVAYPHALFITPLGIARTAP